MEKNKVGGLTISEFKTYYKATVIKTMWFQPKARQRSVKQIKRVEINPHSYSQMIFDKDAKIIQWG